MWWGLTLDKCLLCVFIWLCSFNFSILYEFFHSFLVYSYCLLCKSMGLARSIGISVLIDIFDFFSKTVSQIQFKLGGDVPWVGLYQVCSSGRGPVIFGFLMNFLGSIFGQILKNWYPFKCSANCFEIAYGHFWVGALDMDSRWVTLTLFSRSPGKLHEIHSLHDKLRTIWARRMILLMLVVLSEGQT